MYRGWYTKHNHKAANDGKQASFFSLCFLIIGLFLLFFDNRAASRKWCRLPDTAASYCSWAAEAAAAAAKTGGSFLYHHLCGGKSRPYKSRVVMMTWPRRRTAKLALLINELNMAAVFMTILHVSLETTTTTTTTAMMLMMMMMLAFSCCMSCFDRIVVFDSPIMHHPQTNSRLPNIASVSLTWFSQGMMGMLGGGKWSVRMRWAVCPRYSTLDMYILILLLMY